MKSVKAKSAAKSNANGAKKVRQHLDDVQASDGVADVKLTKGEAKEVKPKDLGQEDMADGSDFKSYLSAVAENGDGDSDGLNPIWIAAGALALGGGVALAGGGAGNKPPTVASPVAASVTEDVAKQITVVGSDPDNDALTYTAAGATKGSVTGGNGGVFTYTPNANANGTDTFTVTVSDGKEQATATVNVTIAAVNDAPTLAVIAAITTAEDAAKAFTAVGADVDSTALTYAASDPTHGTVTGGANGVFTYTPDADFHGTETFTVTVSDGALTSSAQTVTVTVTPVIDEVRSIDLTGTATTQSEDAAGPGFTAGDRFRFTDNSALPTSVVITNFTAGDTIQVSGTATDYNFTAIGDDLEITFNNTAASVENVILIKNVGASTGFIEDEATAELVLGHNFFSALTGPGGGGDGIAVANGNLDDDDDANVQTFAIGSAAGGNIAFSENATIANSVIITGFDDGDTITVSNAPISAYSFTAAGNDVVITYLNGGTSNEIVLQGVATGVTTLIDSLNDVEALVGVGFFKAAAIGTGGGFTPAGTESIDVGNLGSTITKNAASGSIKYTDAIGTATDVIIQGFGSDDRIQTNAANSASDGYSFTTFDDRDLEITFTYTPSGSTESISNTIVLDEILVGKTYGFIDGYASAQAAVGFDFMIFG